MKVYVVIGTKNKSILGVYENVEAAHKDFFDVGKWTMDVTEMCLDFANDDMDIREEHLYTQKEVEDTITFVLTDKGKALKNE